jgi:aspartate carbamoyltransferase catalytic subunit
MLKPTSVIMHPGPINRGLEIDDTAADWERSLILEQVANGVPMRMAVLSRALEEGR